MPTDTVYDKMKVDSVTRICNEISSLMVVLCSDMGTKMQRIRYLSVSELNNAAKGGLHCLVIPAELSEVEITALQRWKKE
jgi:diphthamide biosynthesis methyltransferase